MVGSFIVAGDNAYANARLQFYFSYNIGTCCVHRVLRWWRRAFKCLTP